MVLDRRLNMLADLTIGQLASGTRSKKNRPVFLVVHDKGSEQVIRLSRYVYEDTDTVYFTYDDNECVQLETRDITRICTRVGHYHRVMFKTVTQYRTCVYVIKDVEFKPDALYLHIWDYKTLSFYLRDGKPEYCF